MGGIRVPWIDFNVISKDRWMNAAIVECSPSARRRFVVLHRVLETSVRPVCKADLARAVHWADTAKPRAADSVCLAIAAKRNTIIGDYPIPPGKTAATPLPNPERRREKVLTVSCRPGYCIRIGLALGRRWA